MGPLIIYSKVWCQQETNIFLPQNSLTQSDFEAFSMQKKNSTVYNEPTQLPEHVKLAKSFSMQTISP